MSASKSERNGDGDGYGGPEQRPWPLQEGELEHGHGYGGERDDHPTPTEFIRLWMALASKIRYVDVIRFGFLVLQLLPMRFIQQTLCCISKSLMKRQLKK